MSLLLNRNAIRSEAPLCARVRRDTLQTIANNATTAIIFSAAPLLYDSRFWTSANTTRIIFPRSGVYEIGGHVTWAPNATGTRYTEIRFDGSGSPILCTSSPAVATGGVVTGQVLHGVFFAFVDEYFEIRVYQDSGGNLDTVAARVMAWVNFIG